MDVLVISHLYPSEGNQANGPFVHRQTRELRKRGHNIEVVSPTPWVPSLPGLPQRWRSYRNRPNHAQIDGLRVQYPEYLAVPGVQTLPIKSLFAGRAVKQTSERLITDERFSPDLIHSHVVLPGGVAGLMLSRKYEVPLVTTIHGADFYKYSNHLLSRLAISTVIKNSEAVLLNSKNLYEVGNEYYDLDEIYTKIIHNGISIREIDNAKVSQKTEDESEFVVSSLGFLIERKGHKSVMRAIEGLSPKVRPNYIVIGEGPLREELENYANNLGIREWVEFTGYVSDHQDVFRRLWKSDMMILPSTDEAFGVAHIEAMACRCIVIGCRREGPESFIENGENGFLVDPDDYEKIREIILSARSGEANGEEIVEKARKTVERHFTWEQKAMQIDKVYRRVVREY